MPGKTRLGGTSRPPALTCKIDVFTAGCFLRTTATCSAQGNLNEAFLGRRPGHGADDRSPPSAQDEKGASKSAPELKDTKQKASYGIGLNIGRSMKAQARRPRLPTSLPRGIKDALAGGKALLTDQEIKRRPCWRSSRRCRRSRPGRPRRSAEEQEGGRGLPGGEQGEGRASRRSPAGCNTRCSRRGPARSPRPPTGLGPLPRHPDRRHRVRQLVQEREPTSSRSTR